MVVHKPTYKKWWLELDFQGFHPTGTVQPLFPWKTLVSESGDGVVTNFCKKQRKKGMQEVNHEKEDYHNLIQLRNLGGGFKHFLFSSLFGEMIQID